MHYGDEEERYEILKFFEFILKLLCFILFLTVMAYVIYLVNSSQPKPQKVHEVETISANYNEEG